MSSGMRIGPGAIQLTWTAGANSCASDWVSAITPALDTQYGKYSGYGRIPAQWNVSYTDLINKLTQDGGVPYYLAPGNHDLTSAATHEDPQRQLGLKNFFAANANLIPPDGSPRRM